MFMTINLIVMHFLWQETIGAQAKQWKAVTNRASVKEKYKGAQGFLDRMRSLVEDVRHYLTELQQRFFKDFGEGPPILIL